MFASIEAKLIAILIYSLSIVAGTWYAHSVYDRALLEKDTEKKIEALQSQQKESEKKAAEAEKKRQAIQDQYDAIIMEARNAKPNNNPACRLDPRRVQQINILARTRTAR